MAQRLGLYVAVDASDNPVQLGPDLMLLTGGGWRFIASVDLTYDQLVDPPSGPGSTPVTVLVLEDETVRQSAEEPAGLAGLFNPL